ncbi:MAG: hypothetical protein AABY13_04740 [Nanoarchaeota archaeon]
MRPLTIMMMLVLLAAAVHAQETALVVETTFYKDGSASIDNVTVTLTSIDGENQRALPDALRLALEGQTLYETHVPVTFGFLDAQAPLSSWTVTSRLPYPGNRGVVEVVRGKDVVASFDLRLLCERNDKCEGFENSISCQDDCPITRPDAICLPYKDGACDPDCAKGLDADCALPPAVRPPAGIPWPVYIIGATLILYLLYYFYSQRKR